MRIVGSPQNKPSPVTPPPQNFPKTVRVEKFRLPRTWQPTPATPIIIGAAIEGAAILFAATAFLLPMAYAAHDYLQHQDYYDAKPRWNRADAGGSLPHVWPRYPVVPPQDKVALSDGDRERLNEYL